MKKINKDREKEIEAILRAGEDEEKWDKKQLGDSAEHTKRAPEEYNKTETSSSVGTSIRMPLKLIRELKLIAEEEATIIRSAEEKAIIEHKGGS